MKKVYCKNCVWYVRAVYDDYSAYSDYCSCPTGEIKYNPVDGPQVVISHAEPSYNDYPNKNCDCKQYEKKWWKFWVKE